MLSTPIIRPHLPQQPPDSIHLQTTPRSSIWDSDDEENSPHRRPIRGLSNDFCRSIPINRKQETQRSFRLFSTIGFTSLVIGTWEVLLTANSKSLQNGGLSGLFWTTICAFIGQLFILLSLAELSSMVPSAGGQYQWVAEFASPKYRDALSYCTGILCSLGWQARFTADCYIIAGIIMAVCGHLSEAQWQRNLLTVAIAAAVSVFNAFAAGHLSIVEGFFAIAHVYGLVLIVVSLWVLAPKHSYKDVFATFTQYGSRWSSLPLSTFVGQIPAIFAVQGAEAVTHLAEEVEEPAMILPRCILWSFLTSLPISLAMLLTYVFNVQNVPDSVHQTHPFVHVFNMALGSSHTTTGFTVIVLALMIMIAVCTMVATSRHLFAFGRDSSLSSSSSWLSAIHPKLQVPLNAIYLTFTCTTIFCILTVNHSEVLTTIMGLSASALMASYMTSIGCVVWRRWRGDTLPTACWSLGKSGFAVNYAALVWSGWSFFWSFWPVDCGKALGARNMNWTVVGFLGAVAFSLGCFMIGKKKAGDRRASMEEGLQ